MKDQGRIVAKRNSRPPRKRTTRGSSQPAPAPSEPPATAAADALEEALRTGKAAVLGVFPASGALGPPTPVAVFPPREHLAAVLSGAQDLAEMIERSIPLDDGSNPGSLASFAGTWPMRHEAGIVMRLLALLFEFDKATGEQKSFSVTGWPSAVVVAVGGLRNQVGAFCRWRSMIDRPAAKLQNPFSATILVGAPPATDRPAPLLQKPFSAAVLEGIRQAAKMLEEATAPAAEADPAPKPENGGGAATMQPTEPREKDESGIATRRGAGAKPRNELFLQWYEAIDTGTYRRPAAIRDKWSSMPAKDRQAECPDCAGIVSVHTVRKGIQRARELRDARPPSKPGKTRKKRE